jgi:hypothetical protein
MRGDPPYALALRALPMVHVAGGGGPAVTHVVRLRVQPWHEIPRAGEFSDGVRSRGGDGSVRPDCAGPHPAVHGARMADHGALGNRQPPRDLPAGLPGRDSETHLGLAWRKRKVLDVVQEPHRERLLGSYGDAEERFGARRGVESVGMKPKPVPGVVSGPGRGSGRRTPALQGLDRAQQGVPSRCRQGKRRRSTLSNASKRVGRVRLRPTCCQPRKTSSSRLFQHPPPRVDRTSSGVGAPGSPLGRPCSRISCRQLSANREYTTRTWMVSTSMLSGTTWAWPSPLA